MPLAESKYPPPDSALSGSDPSFLIFYSSREYGSLWCPHCRDVEGIITSAFNGAKKPRGQIVYVGSYGEWKSTTNRHPARSEYGVQFVPTIVKIKDGKQVGKIVKGDILNADTLENFLTGHSMPGAHIA